MNVLNNQLIFNIGIPRLRGQTHLENSVTPCKGAGDKKEETKGVEPSPSILTDRGGNHLDTLTHDSGNPMTRDQTSLL